MSRTYKAIQQFVQVQLLISKNTFNMYCYV
jgi:hypothetical protein